MKMLIVLMLSLICVNASADSLYTGAWSTHINPHEDVNNEKHNLIAYEHSNIVVGYFKNSFSYDSAILLYQYPVKTYGNIDINVGFGATYGYRECPYSEDPESTKAKVCIAVVPEIVYTKYKVQPAVLILGNAIAFSIKWEIE